VWNEHPRPSVSQGLPDVVKEFEFADPLETEQAMDQQYWVAGACIPLHVHTFFAAVRGRCIALHSKTLNAGVMYEKSAENG